MCDDPRNTKGGLRAATIRTCPVGLVGLDTSGVRGRGARRSCFGRRISSVRFAARTLLMPPRWRSTQSKSMQRQVAGSIDSPAIHWSHRLDPWTEFGHELGNFGTEDASAPHLNQVNQIALTQVLVASSQAQVRIGRRSQCSSLYHRHYRLLHP